MIEPMNEALHAFRIRHVRRALAMTGGKKAEAAKLLGIARKTLWDVLKGAPAEEDGVADAIEIIGKAIASDEGYAIAWHANISMAFKDADGDRQEAATRFIRNCFGVDLSGFEWSKKQ